MIETAQQFYERAVAAADGEGRLPLPAQSMWEIFPFEPESLRVKPLDPLTLPEPPRNGEGGDGCWREHLDLGDLDDDMAAELGVLAVRVVRAVEALDSIGRVHLNKFGDGGAHLHAFLLGRPAGVLQLRGSNLALWEEMFPVVPEDAAAAVVAVAVGALADLGEPVEA